MAWLKLKPSRVPKRGTILEEWIKTEDISGVSVVEVSPGTVVTVLNVKGVKYFCENPVSYFGIGDDGGRQS